MLREIHNFQVIRFGELALIINKFCNHFSQVVVVITDDRSGSTAEEIRLAATQLEEKAIHVIVVGIGKTPDVTQLEKMTQKSGDVIKAPKDADPGQLGERIMEKAFQRKIMSF